MIRFWMALALVLAGVGVSLFAQAPVSVTGIFIHDGVNTTRYQMTVDGGAPQTVQTAPRVPPGPEGQNLQFAFSLLPGVHTVTLAACNDAQCSSAASASANVPVPTPTTPTQFKIEITGTGVVTVTPVQ